MKIKIYFLLLLVTTLIFSGCGEDGGDESISTTVQGWHFQGRDCLACHNVDLNPDKHLLFAGTLYKDKNISNQDDLNNVCGGEFIVNFLDSSFSTVYSSNDYIDSNSDGYDAKGNIFILQRKLRLITAGDYYVQITDTNGSVMAVTNGATHSFTSGDYDIDNPADFSNRLSCNSCHSNSGVQDPLYVQVNKNLCK